MFFFQTLAFSVLYCQVMGPQLLVPIDRLVLICPARVICSTFRKHWIQEYTLSLSGFCQCYMLDSMHDGIAASYR